MKPIQAKVSARRTTAYRIGGVNAEQAVQGLTRDNRICGLTNGAFSLISLIRAVLNITGPANVIVSTWSAGFYDAEQMNLLMSSGKVIDFKMILDRSFKTRKEGYSTHIEDIFKPENIRTTNTHAKFVLISNNDGWNICIRSSMNLNENKRCENYDIDNDPDVFNLFKQFSDDLFQKQAEGIIEEHRVINPVFCDLFNQPDDTDQYFQDTHKMIAF